MTATDTSALDLAALEALATAGVGWCNEETFAAICALARRTDAAERALTEAREALRPFAAFTDALEQMGGNTPKKGSWYTLESSVAGERTLTVEDFHAARAALKDAPNVG